MIAGTPGRLVPEQVFIGNRNGLARFAGIRSLGPREVLRPIEGLELKRRMHGFEIGVAMNQGDAVLLRDRGNETIRSRGRHSVFS